MLRYLLLGYLLSVITAGFVLVRSFLMMWRLAQATGENQYTMMYRILYGKHRVATRMDWFAVVLGYVAAAFFWFVMIPVFYFASRRGGRAELSPHFATSMAGAAQQARQAKDLQDYRDCAKALPWFRDQGEEEKVKAIERLMSSIWWRLPKDAQRKLLDEAEVAAVKKVMEKTGGDS